MVPPINFYLKTFQSFTFTIKESEIMHALLMLFFEMVIYKLIIMTLLQHILEKNYTKVHYTVMTASLFFYTFIAMKKTVSRKKCNRPIFTNKCLFTYFLCLYFKML